MHTGKLSCRVHYYNKLKATGWRERNSRARVEEEEKRQDILLFLYRNTIGVYEVEMT